MEFNKPASHASVLRNYKVADLQVAAHTSANEHRSNQYFLSSFLAVAKLSQVQGHNRDHLL